MKAKDKKQQDTQMKDFMLLGLAFGDKAKMKKEHVGQNLLQGFITDSTGKQRPKFIDPRTGKPPKKVKNEVFTLNLGPAKQKPKGEFDDLYMLKKDVHAERR